MYEAYFGFRERPFALTPDPDYMFLAHHHRAALTMLEYGLTQQAPLMVITGEVGCGKTTLIRFLLTRLDSRITVGLITNVRGLDFCVVCSCDYKGCWHRSPQPQPPRRRRTAAR